MNLTWSEADFTYNETFPSEKFNEIITTLKGLGAKTDIDAKHLDTAYKNNCQIFLTRDKGHIINKRANLEKLLNLKIFHPTEEKELVIQYINSYKPK